MPLTREKNYIKIAKKTAGRKSRSKNRNKEEEKGKKKRVKKEKPVQP
jgi:hypothetical protein